MSLPVKMMWEKMQPPKEVNCMLLSSMTQSVKIEWSKKLIRERNFVACKLLNRQF